MKAVLFCGGMGLRLPERTEAIPKPMIVIGYRPLLWHVMRTYAHWGVKDFVLCLGYKADVVKDYFLRTSRSGGSPSPTPGCTPTSASGCRRPGTTWSTRTSSAPTTGTW
jgi:NDP-sugar pyrophosphorylase family protein